MPQPIYLDHAATTPVRPEVLEAMQPFYGARFGNPSSTHRWGREARVALDEARERLARCLGASLLLHLVYPVGDCVNHFTRGFLRRLPRSVLPFKGVLLLIALVALDNFDGGFPSHNDLYFLFSTIACAVTL